MMMVLMNLYDYNAGRLKEQRKVDDKPIDSTGKR
jgi:hypothetical protein